jgi:N6-L-threonylcarbamoyladenine synthase
LTAKCLAALKQTGLKRLVIAGGVGANLQLRNALNALAERKRFEVFYPELALCTDNGAMIAFAAAQRLKNQLPLDSSDYGFNVRPRWPLDAIDTSSKTT